MCATESAGSNPVESTREYLFRALIVWAVCVKLSACGAHRQFLGRLFGVALSFFEPEKFCTAGTGGLLRVTVTF